MQLLFNWLDDDHSGHREGASGNYLPNATLFQERGSGAWALLLLAAVGAPLSASFSLAPDALDAVYSISISMCYRSHNCSFQ